MSSKFSKNPLVDIVKNFFNTISKNKKIMGIYLLGFLFLIGLVVGYFYYKSGLQKKAHKDFVNAMKVYNAQVIPQEDKNLGPDVFTSEQAKWEEVDKVFAQKYEENKRAGIAPFFLAKRVEALIFLGKLPQAIEIQRLLLKNIPGGSDLKTYNKIKLSLMEIDTKLEDNVKKALESLKEIAYDNSSLAQDEALYRLGEYYWNIKDFKEAVNFWNQLKIKFGKTSKSPSPWVEVAKPKLKTIAA